MKWVMSLVFASALSPHLSAQPAQHTQPAFSKPISKNQCSVVCHSTDKSKSFTNISKEKARNLNGELPVAKESISCSDSLQKELDLNCESCEIFCNPS